VDVARSIFGNSTQNGVMVTMKIGCLNQVDIVVATSSSKGIRTVDPIISNERIFKDEG